MSETNSTPQSPGCGQRIWLLFVALFKLTLVAIFLGFVGIATFYGLQLYQQYSFVVNRDIPLMRQAQANQEQVNDQTAQNMRNLQQRINELESQNDMLKQSLGELENQLGRFVAEQQADQQSVQDAQAEAQEEAIARLEEVNTELGEVQRQLTQLNRSVRQTENQIEALEAQYGELEETLADEISPVNVLRRELRLVKAMELVTRSRLSIVESNYGLAIEDIQDARDLLTALSVPSFQQPALDDIILHLDLALENLPDTPLLAAENLEIAWQLLKDGLPGELALPTEAGDESTPQTTLTPAETQAEATPSPTPTPTLTPTPTN